MLVQISFLNFGILKTPLTFGGLGVWPGPGPGPGLAQGPDLGQQIWPRNDNNLFRMGAKWVQMGPMDPNGSKCKWGGE